MYSLPLDSTDYGTKSCSPRLLQATFPKGASDAIPVVAEDISRLAPEEFLNDSVIDYYMRFLWQGLNGEGKVLTCPHNTSLSAGLQQPLCLLRPNAPWRFPCAFPQRCCHFFNSYFYKKLTEPCKDIPRMDQVPPPLWVRIAHRVPGLFL